MMFVVYVAKNGCIQVCVVSRWIEIHVDLLSFFKYRIL